MSTPAVDLAGTNPEAAAYAEKFGAEMVTAITDETKGAIRAVIARSIREGIPPYESARMIADLIGMNSQQAQAAVEYRAELIDAGHPADEVERLFGEYADGKIEDRADLISHTETMEALNEGQLEAWSDAQEEGLLGENATKEWVATDDEHICPICEDLDGEEVALDATFDVDGEEMDGPPAHPACRCTLAVNP